MTVVPAPTAGRMTSPTIWRRAALKSSASVSGSVGAAFAPVRASRTWRTRSPSHVPPGSRVRSTRTPRAARWSRRRSAWVVLPPPSGPSIVMNAPWPGVAVGDIGCECSRPLGQSRHHPPCARPRTLRAMGRHLGSSLSSRAGRLRRSAAVTAAIAVLLVLPGFVAAHPLGNFTINHYAEVRIEPEQVLLDVVIDQAEIAAFQARQDFDTDGDGSVSDEEIEAGRITACAELAPDLRLTANDGVLELRTIEAGLSFPPGVGGLPTMRLVCGFGADLTRPVGAEPTRIAFGDESYADRLG